MHTKTTTILIAGAVLTAGFMMGLGGYVFAGNNYNSSRSNTSTGIINRDVGNLLIDYGYGGEVVNQVTEALARGVTTDGLRAILSGTSARSPAVVEEVLQKLEVELERLGIGINEEGIQAVSTPGTGNVPQPAIIHQELHRPPTSVTGQPTPVGEQRFKSVDGLDSETEIIEIKDGDDMSYRRVLLQQRVQALRQNLRENSQELRDNFRENVKTTIGNVDHGKTARIAVAHGKGLRMINRYSSAIARFDHILDRLESRVEKIENEAQARSEGTIKNVLPSAILLIEEAKNTQVLNKAKLAELEAKYESLLTGKNPGGVAEEARAIAKELKSL